MATWKFERGAWAGIPDVMDRDSVEDRHDIIEKAGYKSKYGMHYGSFEKGLDVEVYMARQDGNPAHPYFLDITIGKTSEYVYVGDFPSLLMLLRQISTIEGNLSELPEDHYQQ